MNKQSPYDQQPTVNPKTLSDTNISHPINILRMKQLPKKVGICRSKLYELIKAGRFPAPLQLCGGREKGFVESEIDAWLIDQIKKNRLGRSASMIGGV